MMNKNTNNLENFQVYVDGELQQPTIAERAGKAAVSFVEASTSRLLGKVGQVATNALNHVDLAFYDCQHNTNMHGEYIARQKALAETALREQYDLVS